MYGAASAPTGWLLCDGSAVSRSTYATLFALIGTTYGAGDGSTTFNVPDMRGRVIAAPDNMGGTAAGRMNGATANSSQTTNFNAPGVTGGDQEHVQSLGELRSHNHGISNTNHTHSYESGVQQDGDGPGSGGSTNPVPKTTGNPNSWNPSIDSQGSSHPMNNVQPTMAMNYIIFANA